MEFPLILAQVGTNDSTGRQISYLIIALLVVALLLALLTIWYWWHTDPKRRGRRPLPAETPNREIPTQRVIRPEPEAVAADYAADEGVSVDEWLSLTGPEALRKR